MRSRRRRLSLASVAGVLLALVVAPAASACACGGVAPPVGANVSVAQERAIISRQGPVEQIELSLGLQSKIEQTGLIFPTPAPAEVQMGDKATFEQIETAIQPRAIVQDDWWGDFGSSAAGGAAGPGGGPEILKQVQLGPVQATTLKATDATGLKTWLAKNDYQIPPAVTALLNTYIERGWYFVALRITTGTSLSGILNPLRFTFDSERLVYPMELSRAAASPQNVRLYVFDEHRTRAAPLADPNQGVPQAFTGWAGVAPSGLDGLGSYLTVVDLHFNQPATDIPGDLVLVQSEDDAAVNSDYHVQRLVTFLGIPAGWAIVIAAAALSLLVTLVLWRRGRLTRSPRLAGPEPRQRNL